MGQTLIKETKYNGRYVALEDFGSNIVVASGDNPKDAYEIAVKKGYSSPVILYVPVKNMVQIY
jgi:hypothetical protein